MNDEERRLWIMNDEGLYNWYLSEHRQYKGPTIQQFIKEHRQELDEVIGNVTGNKKPAHYLAYGG